MSKNSLYKNGQKWVYAFAIEDKKCFIVGDNVKFNEEKEKHITVSLDSRVIINVSKNGRHQVLLVNSSGITEVAMEINAKTNYDLLISETIKKSQQHNK
ncbi:MAG: hypothetical protein NE330_22065 [Lentisphaeraceae bacterium]|nr:hypothetical protein [Lentisphaeraceae bacterium]